MFYSAFILFEIFYFAQNILFNEVDFVFYNFVFYNFVIYY